MTKPDLSTYGGRLRALGYAGELVDMNVANIETRINESNDPIDFGGAVARGAADNGGKLPATAADKIIGLAVRHAIMPADASGIVNYLKDKAVPVFISGGTPMYIPAAEDAVAGEDVNLILATNTLGSATKAALVVPTAGAAAALNTNVGNGVFGAVTADAGAMLGDYQIVIIEPGSNAGIFEVFKPDGTIDGDGTVAVAYDGSINFTLADGATDFAAGDAWTVTVGTAGRIALDGKNGNIHARWESTTAAGEIGLVRIV